VSNERDGELKGCSQIGCETPLKFKGGKKTKKHGYMETWFCPEHEEYVRFNEDGELIE
jgi:hypothetical protein